MKRLAIQRKEPFYLGLLLIAASLFLKRLIELALSADARIEAPRYLAVIYTCQILGIVVGLFLLIKQPAVRLPSKTNLALVVFSLTLTFLSLEVAARLWLAYLATPDQKDEFVLYTSIQPIDYAWTPHQYLTYVPNPNYRRGLTGHNSLGYRNNEFPLEKPNGVFRIVALGGSSTYDVAIPDNAATFTAQLEKVLRDDYGYQEVQVINAGVPGYNSWEILVNLEFRVLDLDPDLVIIYENTNDVHARLVAPAAYRGDDSGRRQPWQPPPVAWWEHSAFLRILSRIANLTRQVGVDDFVSSATYYSWPFESRLNDHDLDPAQLLKDNPPVYYQRNLENMVAVAQAHHIEILLSTWAYSPYLGDYASLDYYQRGFVENNAVIKNVAASRAVPLFDFAALMPQSAEYWADGRHSNEAGALEKAELFAKFIDAQGLIHP
jgi:lysophospholipase L1-like esterase